MPSKEIKNNVKIMINHIIKIKTEKILPTETVKIFTARSKQLWLQPQTSEYLTEIFELLQTALSDQIPVGISYDFTTRQILGAFYPSVEKILGLKDSQVFGEEVIVVTTTSLRPTKIFLLKDHERFSELYEQLSQAYAKAKTGVLAALAVPGHEIHDVLILEPHAPYYGK